MSSSSPLFENQPIERSVPFVCANDSLIAIPLYNNKDNDDGDILRPPHLNESLHGLAITHIATNITETLRGHDMPVTAMCIASAVNVVVSCSSDAIIIWEIDASSRRPLCGRTLPARQHHRVLSCDIDANASRLVVLCDDLNDDDRQECVVIDVRSGRQEFIIDNGPGVVCGHVRFLGNDGRYVVTVCDEDEQRFMIYDLEARRQEYDSRVVLGMGYITSVATHPITRDFAIGDVDGQVRVYRFTPGNGVVQLHQLRLPAVTTTASTPVVSTTNAPVVVSASSHLTQRAMMKRLLDATARGGDDGDGVDEMRQQQQQQQQQCSVVSMTFVVEPEVDSLGYLCVCTPTHVVCVRVATFETVAVKQVISAATNDDDDDDDDILRIGASTFGLQSSQIVGIMCGAFSPRVVMMTDMFGITKTTTTSNNNNNNNNNTSGSDCNDESGCLLRGSIAGDQKENESPLSRWQYAQSLATTKKKKTKKSNDRPVTFHRNIRSSGYGSKPTTPNLRWKGGGATKKKTRPPPPSSTTTTTTTMPVVNEWETNDAGSIDGASTLLCCVPVHSQRVTSMIYSLDGRHLLTSSTDHSVIIQKHSPPSTTSTTTSTCGVHNALVLAASFSRSKQYVLSCGADRQVHVWRTNEVKATRQQPALTITNTAGYKQAASADNLFANTITFSSFFHNDRFIALASGNEFLMYKYLIQDTQKNDLVRVSSVDTNAAKYTRVFRASVDSHGITSAACMNVTDSATVVLADSKKSLLLLDMTNGKQTTFRTAAHDRHITSIVLNEQLQHTFITTGVDGCVKLWDSRTNGLCVRRLQGGHVNNTPAHNIGVALSTCGRYVGSGSEDGVACVYDVGSGHIARQFPKFTGNSPVTQIAFHPWQKHCALAGSNGHVVHYKL